MVASVRVTEGVFDTGTGLQQITISGAGTCVGYIIFYGLAEINDSTTNGSFCGVGIVASDGSAATNSGGSEHNQDPTDTGIHHDSTSSAVRLLGAGGGADIAAGHNGFVTDGFELDLQINNNNQQRFKAILFFGNEINCELGTLTASASDETEVTVGVTQVSDLLFCLTTHTTVEANFADHNRSSFGCAMNHSGTIVQYGTTYFDEHNVGTTNVREATSNNRIAHEFDAFGTSITTGYSVTEMDSTDIGITTHIDSGTPATRVFNCLSVNFSSAVDFFVGSATLPTSTGNTTHGGVGFTPQWVMLAVPSDTAYDDEVGGGTTTAGQSLFFCLADGTGEYCIGSSSEDASNRSDASCNTDVIMVNTDDHAGVSEHEGTWSAWTSDGVTVNYTLAPVAYTGWIVAVEEETVVGGAVVQDPIMQGGVIPFAR